VQAALSSPLWRRRAYWLLGVAAIALGIYWSATHIPRTVTAFVIAAFIAFGVFPIVLRLERWMPRAVAIGVIYLGLLLVAVALVFLVLPATAAQLQAIVSDAPQYIASTQVAFNQAELWLHDHFGRSYLPQDSGGDLNGFVSAKTSEFVSAGLASATEVVGWLFSAAFITIGALVLSAFFLFQGEHVGDAFYNLLPPRRRGRARALGNELGHVLSSYVSGQTVVCLVTGVFVWAACALVGFKFALLVGIFAGVSYAVPFAGQILTHALALVLSLPQGTQTVLWVQGLIFTIFRISDNVLVPRIMARSVGVSPIAVIFATFAGGELFGVPGLLLGIPAAALVRVAWRFFRSAPALGDDAESLPLPHPPSSASPSGSAPSTRVR
jgi:predicted PurR-regulated permease PerM